MALMLTKPHLLSISAREWKIIVLLEGIADGPACSFRRSAANRPWFRANHLSYRSPSLLHLDPAGSLFNRLPFRRPVVGKSSEHTAHLCFAARYVIVSVQHCQGGL